MSIARRMLAVPLGVSLAGAVVPPAALAQQTIFTLGAPVPLSQTVDALVAAEVRVLDFHHSGATEGGFVLGDESLPEAAQDYRQDYLALHGAEPQISAFTLQGAVPTEALGVLAPRITSREQADMASSPPAEAPTTGEYPLRNWVRSEPSAPRRVRARATARAKQFAPLFGTARTYNRGATKRPRRISHAMTWAKGSLDAFERRFFFDHAYEHDFKLVDPGFNGSRSHPFCFGMGDHWARRSGFIWDTNYPRDAKPYFDDNVADHCGTLDFTIGVKFPLELTEGVQYNTLIQAPTGDTPSSPYQLVASKLARLCGGDPRICAVNSPGGDSQLLIGPSKGRAPDCRRWRKATRSRKC